MTQLPVWAVSGAKSQVSAVFRFLSFTTNIMASSNNLTTTSRASNFFPCQMIIDQGSYHEYRSRAACQPKKGLVIDTAKWYANARTMFDIPLQPA